MYIRSRDQFNYIKKITINFGEEMGQEKPEDCFIVLREMPTMTLLELSEATEGGNKAVFEFFRSVLPSLIVQHNLYETEADLMTPEGVAEVVFDSEAALEKIFKEYSEWVNFIRGRGEKSK